MGVEMGAQHRSWFESGTALRGVPPKAATAPGARHPGIALEGGPTGGGDGDGGDDAGYRRELGARLRQVRHARGLRLQDVEERSGGSFNAVVIGSYERGDRGMSAQRLAALAAFYQVRVTELLPDEPPSRPPEQPGLCVAVDRLRAAGDDPAAAPLWRLVQHIQWRRGDYNGRCLSLREDDLQAVAVALGIAPQDLGTWLRQHDLLAE